MHPSPHHPFIRRHGHHAALALATALLLAACGGGGANVTAVCPESGIIHGLDRAVLGDGADASRVTLENIDGLCTYDGGRLSLEMSVDLVTDAPPGTVIPYFVVITDPAGEVLDKSNFTATVPADATDRPVRLREQLQQEISNVAAGTSTGYSILYGLDLPPAIAIEQRRSL